LLNKWWFFVWQNCNIFYNICSVWLPCHVNVICKTHGYFLSLNLALFYFTAWKLSMIFDGQGLLFWLWLSCPNTFVARSFPFSQHIPQSCAENTGLLVGSWHRHILLFFHMIASPFTSVPTLSFPSVKSHWFYKIELKCLSLWRFF
jgi:hypothetical protein